MAIGGHDLYRFSPVWDYSCGDSSRFSRDSLLSADTAGISSTIMVAKVGVNPKI